MSDFLESVTIFLGKISNLIKDSKQKLYWIANYEAAFQNLSSTSKEKSFQWKKNFSDISNDLLNITTSSKHGGSLQQQKN